jgi:hypothetical protein
VRSERQAARGAVPTLKIDSFDQKPDGLVCVGSRSWAMRATGTPRPHKALHPSRDSNGTLRTHYQAQYL